MPQAVQTCGATEARMYMEIEFVWVQDPSGHSVGHFNLINGWLQFLWVCLVLRRAAILHHLVWGLQRPRP